MGSIITGSKLSGRKECYLWHMCVVGMFRTLTAEATLGVTLRPCRPLTPRKCPPAEPVYQLWHDVVAGSPTSELGKSPLFPWKSSWGGEGSRQVKIASVEYSGLGISVSLLNSRAQGVRWSAQLWTGLVSLSLPAPPAKTPCTQALSLLSLPPYLEQHLLAVSRDHSRMRSSSPARGTPGLRAKPVQAAASIFTLNTSKGNFV